jgi:hypothetical protein
VTNEIYAQVKWDCNETPFIMYRGAGQGYSESRVARLNFIKRGNKFYVKATLKTWPTEHENERHRFDLWLKKLCRKYGWTPHLTSGGTGVWTYRLNGDLGTF